MNIVLLTNNAKFKANIKSRNVKSENVFKFINDVSNILLMVSKAFKNYVVWIKFYLSDFSRSIWLKILYG